MALTTIPLPFGLRDVKLTPYTDATATVLAGTSVDLPNSRTLSFAEVETFEELRGDDRLVATHGAGPQVEWELEGGGVSFEAVRTMYGGTISETGTTPNQVKTLRKLVTDQRPYFRIFGQVISDSGGDIWAVIYRAKASDNLTGEFADGQFFLTGASGLGLSNLVPAELDRVWDFVQHETATAIP
jgi:asparagine N-glycosylation enzyme membrane subunit Stt3